MITLLLVCIIVLLNAGLIFVLLGSRAVRRERDEFKEIAETRAKLHADDAAHARALGDLVKALRSEHDAALKKLEFDLENLEEKNASLTVQLHNAKAPLRPPAIEDMDAEEFRAAFDVENDNALWQGVHRLLDLEIVAGVDDVAPAPSAVFSGEARTHAAGELNSLREFQKSLLRWQREARRANATVGAGSEGE